MEHDAESQFELRRKQSGILLAPAAFAIVYSSTGGSLRPEGRSLAAVLAAVSVLWITETLPLPVTAVLGACLCVLLGVADAAVVFAKFADPSIFLFIGSFILARAMTLHQLDRRLALRFLSLRWVGGRPNRILFAIGVVTVSISMWVSNTATAAMMTPISLGILDAIGRARRSALPRQAAREGPFATSMLLIVAYGAAIGGIGTPVGSPPNLTAISQLAAHGVTIGFFQWMSVCVPLLAVMTLVLYALLRWLHPDEDSSHADPRELKQFLVEQRQSLGGWTAGQRNTAFAFGLAITLWVLPGVLDLIRPELGTAFKSRVPESIASLVAALLLFVLPTDRRRGQFTITWDEAAKIDWGTILLFGGGLTLGSLMDSKGVAAALGQALIHATGVDSLWGLTAMAIVVGLILSETSSNTAAANMVIPIVIGLAKEAHVNVLPPVLGACLGASYGFMLPVSTPPNAIVYGTGLVPITRMIRAGILFDVLGAVLIYVGLRLLCPWLGMV